MFSFVVTVESLIYGQVAGWLVQVDNFRALITDLFADGTDVENLTAWEQLGFSPDTVALAGHL